MSGENIWLYVPGTGSVRDGKVEAGKKQGPASLSGV